MFSVERLPMNSAPVRHLLEGSSPFISGPAGISRGFRVRLRRFTLRPGMTPRSSIHLPITALLSSGQVVQNVSDRDTSTTSPLSSTTSTEPRVPLEVAVIVWDPDALPCAGMPTGSSHPRPPVPFPDEPCVTLITDTRPPLPRAVDRSLLAADIAPAEFDLRPRKRPVVEDPGEGLHS